MKNKRLILIFGVIIVFFICFSLMNKSFDRLSRYPYEDPHDRELIDQYLNDEEIEYLIEYSIAPAYFIKYIESPGFNIYHIDSYQKIEDNYWYLNYDQIVNFTETLLTYDDGLNTALSLAPDYYYEDVLTWLKDGDVFNASTVIITNPEDELAYLDDDHTMSKRVPYNLVKINIANNGEEFLLKADAAQAFEQMCKDLAQEFGGESGGVYLVSAYLSYDEQVAIYHEAISQYQVDYLKYVDYPGHSEHQLGLAVDIQIGNYSDITDSEQYAWLLANAYKYGFVQTYAAQSQKENGKDPRPQHWRYVGLNAATTMHANNWTLKEYLNDRGL